MVTTTRAMMLDGMLTFAKALADDQLTDDTLFIYDLVEAVRILFICHAELAKMSSYGKAHQRKWQCIIACHVYAETSCGRDRLQSSWANLGVRERHQFRNAVRCSGTIKRNKMLLELAGTKVPSGRTSAEAPKEDTEGYDITQCRSPRLQRRRHRVAL